MEDRELPEGKRGQQRARARECVSRANAQLVPIVYSKAYIGPLPKSRVAVSCGPSCGMGRSLSCMSLECVLRHARLCLAYVSLGYLSQLA